MALSEQPLAGFRPRRGAAQAQAGPPPRACLRPTCPTLDYQARFSGSLGSRPGNWKPSLYPRGPRDFPWTLLSAGLPPPQRQSAQGRPGDLGPRRGSGDSASPGGHGLGGRDTRPWMGSLLGTQACARLGGSESSDGSNCPTMPRGGQLGQSGFNSLKSGLNYAGRDCDRCDPGPPEWESTSP